MPGNYVPRWSAAHVLGEVGPENLTAIASARQSKSNLHPSFCGNRIYLTRYSDLDFLEMYRSTLLSDAECAEDQIQDVVSGSGAGDGVQRAQSIVKIEQQHFVRNLAGDGIRRLLQRCQ
jgi:hypothetical protein